VSVDTALLGLPISRGWGCAHLRKGPRGLGTSLPVVLSHSPFPCQLPWAGGIRRVWGAYLSRRGQGNSSRYTLGRCTQALGGRMLGGIRWAGRASRCYVLRRWLLRLEVLSASINTMPEQESSFGKNARYVVGLCLFRVATVGSMASENRQLLLYRTKLACHGWSVEWALVSHEGETKLRTKNDRSRGECW